MHPFRHGPECPGSARSHSQAAADPASRISDLLAQRPPPYPRLELPQRFATDDHAQGQSTTPKASAGGFDESPSAIFAPTPRDANDHLFGAGLGNHLPLPALAPDQRTAAEAAIGRAELLRALANSDLIPLYRMPTDGHDPRPSIPTAFGRRYELRWRGCPRP